MGSKNGTAVVKVTDLQPDAHNANKGTPRGMALLNASLRRNGAGRSILLDKHNRVIAGNKTLEQAVDVGLEDVVIIETDGKKLVAVKRMDLDLDEAQARELAYADNRIAELDLEWNPEQMRLDWEAGQIGTDLWTQQELAVWLPDLPGPEADTFDDLSDELPGAQALKASMMFPSDEVFDIPPLRADMLAELPEPIDVWVGADVSDMNWDGWWLYNYGSDSIRGLDASRTVMAFYTDDYRFENWFTDPAHYVSKALNLGITTMIAPNFSLWYGEPRALHIFNTFRSRYLGRYMQEAGLALIPDVNWADEHSFEFCLAGIPVGAPCIAIQVQTVASEDELQRQRYGIARSLDVLKPGSLLLYGGGQEVRRSVASVLPDTLHVVWVEGRQTRRSRNIDSTSKR